ncbi:DUF1232 domain-containing protein [Peribacillus cavernae]|uniref:DUF1232 domain-containing protein n=1 Tax=Peribacillus cavernae TaxID=1674310 RepID=A0A433HC08_9BACI|nr:YkvA family protein [Peribacillus cavernae]MDQ0219591.1 uncharacterized membrane protein YkvA (DUF1232 family) [Peribacillus cavernae]RUQ25881.1 DUF1232 domain-containing protein [Peribacillus cavernae]
MIKKLKAWARELKRNIYTLYFAYRDKRAPWYAKVFTAFIVAYAFSPIDLIPDFIPILGYLDDIIIVPAGVWIALKLLPDEVIKNAKMKAEGKMGKKPVNWVMGTLILTVWLLLLAWLIYFLFE